MGIMHKLLKQRVLERQNLIMDMTSSKNISNDTPADNTAAETVAAEVDLVPKLATDDNQFTAEHILQLCKFLAEKSKRNKTQTYSLPISSPNKTKYHIQQQQQKQELQADSHIVANTDELTNLSQCPRLMLNDASATRLLARNCLAESNFGHTTSVGHSTTTTVFNPQHHQEFECAQEKRIILLKIRHQIFERKRRRQTAQAQHQLDVWRPW